MIDTQAVAVLAHSATRDPVEALNSLLRRAGLAVHCTWIPGVQDVPDALEQLNPELLISVEPDSDTLAQLCDIRDEVAAAVPLVVVRESVTEPVIAADMNHGARDTVTLAQQERVQRVIQRELRAFRMERTLITTLRSAKDYRHQIESVLQHSNDAIAQVQEGIIVDANSSWTELFGAKDPAELVGQPLMDHFNPDTQAPLRGALSACLQGRWSGHTLRATAVLPDGSGVELELVLTLGEHEGDPCVRLLVPARKQDEQLLASELAEAVRHDPVSGLLRRRYLLEDIQKRLQQPLRGGVRYLACIRPDRFAELEKDVGSLAAEDLLMAVASIVRSKLAPSDIAGHFGGTNLLVWLERGNRQDVEAWSEQLVERLGQQPLQLGNRSISLTVSIGLGLVPQSQADLNSALADALAAMRRARERGGNQILTIGRADTDARVVAYDQIWVKHIRAALLENRFKLVQQPVANLRGDAGQIFDVAIRMLNPEGKEILPSEFLPAAERNDLMKSIDRWVISAALSFASKNRPDMLFVRLSAQTALDLSTLLPWLDSQIKARQFEPKRLCLQVTARFASEQSSATRQLAEGLRSRGLRFALEHFGNGEKDLTLLEQLPMDFVRIDGALTQDLAGNTAAQGRVHAIVELAGQKGIQTVAERIEDANTMAVVWQLGVQYIQGYLVHAPEEVILKS